MKRVILTYGLPGAGKTHWAKQMVEQNPGVYKNICKDDIRAMLDFGKWSQKNEDFTIKVRDTLILMALKAGRSVIVSDTNFGKHKEHINNLIRGNREMVGDVLLETVFFDIPVEECIKRDLARPNSVGQEVILRMWNKHLRKTEKVERNPSLPDCVIADIDGTLARMSDRGIFDYAKVENDYIVAPVRLMLNSYPETKIILSGREDDCRKETESWLKKHGVQYDQLYMRKKDDNRDDRIVKKELYAEHILGKHNVVCVFDDRPKVVRMWKDLGLYVFNCNQGDERVEF